MSLLEKLISLPAKSMILLVRGYQKFISPLFPPKCRFTPSCSEYFILSVRKHGAVKGACKGTWRILRCNPFCEGGEDLP